MALIFPWVVCAEDRDLVAVVAAQGTESPQAVQPQVGVDLRGLLQEVEFGMGQRRVRLDLPVVEVSIPGVQEPAAGVPDRDCAVS